MLEYHVSVAQSKLIKISQKNPLTEVEKKAVFTMYSMANSMDEENKIYEIPVGEVYDILGIQGPERNFQLSKIMDDLLSKVVVITRENGNSVSTHWIGKAEYKKGSEMLHFRLSPDFNPYFLQMKNYLAH